MMDTERERQPQFANGIPQTVTMSEGLVSCLDEEPENIPPDEAPALRSIAPSAHSRKVFVVHGYDRW